MPESCISWETIKSILDPSVILFTPWTTRKILYWLMYAAILTFAVIAQLLWRWWSYFEAAIRVKFLPLGIVLFVLEPLMILLAIVSVWTYPVARKKVTHRPGEVVNGKRTFVKVDDTRATLRRNKDLAVVIACHKSRDIIPNTVKACLNHVKPEQIYIVDNGNTDEPLDDSKEVLRQCSPKSHYIWNGFGNKTLAQYAGVMACRKYKYVLVLDDDVILPKELDMGLDLIKDKTVGVVYPIRACHRDRIYSLFVEWQSLEYQLTGYNKLMQHKFGTVQYPHGAASLWERSSLKKALRSHDTIFYGEDAKLGIWAQKNGYELKMKPEVLIYTETPTTFLGPMPNYWTQRVRSWDMALHCYIFQYTEVLLCTAHSSICGTLLMKLTQGYTLFSIIADWLRVPVIIVSATLTEFWIYLGMVVGVLLFMLFTWNLIAYWNRPDLRLSMLCVATFPIYSLLVLFTRFFGLLHALFIYLPNYKRPPKIPEIEDEVIESWNRACEEGCDEPDEENALGREPVWVAEDGFDLSTCARSIGPDTLISSPLSRASTRKSVIWEDLEHSRSGRSDSVSLSVALDGVNVAKHKTSRSRELVTVEQKDHRKRKKEQQSREGVEIEEVRRMAALGGLQSVGSEKNQKTTRTSKSTASHAASEVKEYYLESLDSGSSKRMKPSHSLVQSDGSWTENLQLPHQSHTTPRRKSPSSSVQSPQMDQFSVDTSSANEIEVIAPPIRVIDPVDSHTRTVSKEAKGHKTRKDLYPADHETTPSITDTSGSLDGWHSPKSDQSVDLSTVTGDFEEPTRTPTPRVTREADMMASERMKKWREHAEHNPILPDSTEDSWVLFDKSNSSRTTDSWEERFGDQHIV